MRLLDRVREVGDVCEERTGICDTCGNLVQVTKTAIGCEAHDKLILPMFPPYHTPNNKCPDWIKREETI